MLGGNYRGHHQGPLPECERLSERSPRHAYSHCWKIVLHYAPCENLFEIDKVNWSMSGLGLLNIDKEIQIDTEAVVDIFSKRKPRRLAFIFKL